MLPITVAGSSSGRVMKTQGEGAVLGVFFPIDNALYNRAFGTHTRTGEPIEMPFGMMTENFWAQAMQPKACEGDTGIAQRGRSLISAIALLCLFQVRKGD